MTPPPLQVTRFDRLLRQLSEGLFGGLRGSWRRRSLAWLALLIGFYLGQNVTSLWLIQVGKRPLAVLGLVLLMELVIRVRSRWVKGVVVPLPWLMVDNLRVGLVYAVVLEGFKLGS